MGRDSSVGVGTALRAGRSGDRIPAGGEIFRTRTDRSLLYNGYQGSVLGVQRPGRGVDHPPTSAEVKDKVELHLYSAPVTSWPFLV